MPWRIWCPAECFAASGEVRRGRWRVVFCQASLPRNYNGGVQGLHLANVTQTVFNLWVNPMRLFVRYPALSAMPAFGDNAGGRRVTGRVAAPGAALADEAGRVCWPGAFGETA